ncbi:Uma2 family endonuclease [Okeania sp. SIO2C2]|uniref:Uma2 family endonuclease n=1 Tax=Okeania sp. SIO2C2 TaxID=2607787 RepID=UPI00338DE3A4
MIASPQNFSITLKEYLQMEEKSQIKHEYIDGEIYAMAGASDAHITIAGNLFALLLSHVRGGGCRVYIYNIKAIIETKNKNKFYYPDVMVTCDSRDQ